QSTSHGANTASFAPASPSLASALACATDASVCTPATRNCVSKIGKDIPATIGRCNAAPADARSAFGEYGLAVPLWPEAAVAAPVAPNAEAVRIIVPTLPGSCTPASTTSNGEQAPSGFL